MVLGCSNSSTAQVVSSLRTRAVVELPTTTTRTAWLRSSGEASSSCLAILVVEMPRMLSSTGNTPSWSLALSVLSELIVTVSGSDSTSKSRARRCSRAAYGYRVPRARAIRCPPLPIREGPLSDQWRPCPIVLWTVLFRRR